MKKTVFTLLLTFYKRTNIASDHSVSWKKNIEQFFYEI